MRKQVKQTKMFPAVTMSMNTHGTLNVSALLHDNSKLEMNITRVCFTHGDEEDNYTFWRDTITTNTGHMQTDISSLWDVEQATKDQPEIYKLYTIAYALLEATYELPKPDLSIISRPGDVK